MATQDKSIDSERLREWAREQTSWPVDQPIAVNAAVYVYKLNKPLAKAGESLVRRCAEIATQVAIDNGDIISAHRAILREYGLEGK